MPVYSSSPPVNPRGNALPVIRVAPGKVLNALVTSPDLIGTRTHFWHMRTVPCEDSDCRPCQEGMPWRWHGYLGIWLPTPNQQYLLELSAQACLPLVHYRSTYGTLRACNILARRATMAKNSRVIVETRPGNVAELKLPPAPFLEHCLAILWNLPLPALTNVSREIEGAAVQVSAAATLDARCLPIGPYAEALAHRIANRKPLPGQTEFPQLASTPPAGV